MEQYFAYFENKFEEISDNEKAVKQEQYMRNKFKFYGFAAAERHKIVNEFLKNLIFPKQNKLIDELKLLWSHDYRDMQHVGMYILAKYQKKNKFDDLQFIEFMITEKSWWDTVDFIASNNAFNYFNDFPKEIHKTVDKWIASENIWLQRSCLIFQLKKNKKTDIDLLFSVIERLKHDNEFFIQKAIGWSLRQYSKINPQLVIDYVEKNDFSNLAKREALKYINRKTK